MLSPLTSHDQFASPASATPKSTYETDDDSQSLDSFCTPENYNCSQLSPANYSIDYYQRHKAIINATNCIDLNSKLINDRLYNVLHLQRNHLILALSNTIYYFKCEDIFHPLIISSFSHLCSSVCLNNDSSLLFTTLTYGNAYLFDRNKFSKPIAKIKTNIKPLYASAWVNDTVVVGSGNGDIRIVYTKSGECQTIQKKLKSTIWGIKHCPNSNYVAIGSNDSITLWDIRYEGNMITLTHDSNAKAMCYNSSNPSLLATSKGSKLLIWNQSTLKNEVEFETNSQISCIAWNSDRLVTMHDGARNNVFSWAHSGVYIPECEYEGHTERVLSGYLNDMNDSLYTIGGDNKMRIWAMLNK